MAEQKGITIAGSKALSVAVLDRALIDIEGRGISGRMSVKSRTWEDYADAVLWAASSKATVWFDILGWSQANVLKAMRWSEHADVLLTDDRADLTTEQIEFLENGKRELASR